jgi:hypothetical protein
MRDTQLQETLERHNFDVVFNLEDGEHIGYDSTHNVGVLRPVCYNWWDTDNDITDIEPDIALDKLRKFGISRDAALKFVCDVARGYEAVALYANQYGIEAVFEADREVATWSPREVMGNCDAEEEFVHRTYFVTQSLDDTVEAAIEAGLDWRSIVLGLACFPITTKQLAAAILARG